MVTANRMYVIVVILMNLGDRTSVHCIGIGGIGISAVAKLLAARGVKVFGSDETESEITRDAATAGISVLIGHRAENVSSEISAVIYSEAVPFDNPERVAARERGIPELAGAEVIGALTGEMRAIAVSGTNGKSTTTAILGLILEAAGWDPTVIVGSKVKSFPLGNVRVGKSDWLVLEADEYRAKFLNYSPEAIVVTNIEEDHLDFYHGIRDITEAFQKFVSRARPGGLVCLNADDAASNDISCDAGSGCRLATFGMETPADYLARNLRVEQGSQRFDILRTSGHEERLGEYTLRIPGRFNVMNALAAASCALELGIGPEIIRGVLEKFPGIWRRFEVVGEREGATIVSDYGHHPTAIRGTLSAAREFYPGRRIVLVFQPHHHRRTRALFDQFAESFKGADLTILADVYDVAGREEGDRVPTDELVAAAKKEGAAVLCGGSLDATRKVVEEQARPGDVVIIMGAGDIDTIARHLVS